MAFPQWHQFLAADDTGFGRVALHRPNRFQEALRDVGAASPQRLCPLSKLFSASQKSPAIGGLPAVNHGNACTRPFRVERTQTGTVRRFDQLCLGGNGQARIGHAADGRRVSIRQAAVSRVINQDCAETPRALALAA